VGVAVLSMMAVAAATEKFYVDPVNGQDHWSGRIASPNATKTDGPKRTLVGARDGIRTLRFQNWGGDGNYFQVAPIAEVLLAPGRYKMTQPLELTNWESRTIWRSMQPGAAILDGGMEFRTRVNPPEIPAKMRAARLQGAYLLCFSLNGLPTELFRHPGASGFAISTEFAPSIPIVNGEPLRMAQYPNTGWLTIDSVPNNNGTSFQSGMPSLVSTFRKGGSMVQGYLAFNWTYSTIPVQSYGSDGSVQLTTASFLGQQAGQRFRFVNVFEELDTPGEYFMDPQRRLLYVVTDRRGATSTRQVSMPVNKTKLIDVYQSKNVVFDGLGFSAARNLGIGMAEAQDVVVRRCKFDNILGAAVNIGNSTNCGVEASDFTNMGTFAIYLDGGDRATLTRGNNYARNNHISDISQFVKTGYPGIYVLGVGQTVSNNRIENGPQGGMTVNGNDHLVEKNEFVDLCLEAGDSGVLYSGGNVTYRGNIFRNNLFVNIQATAPNPYIPGAFDDVSAIYLDDAASGYEITGNVFHNVRIGVHIHGGSDNKIRDNIGALCSEFTRFSDGLELSLWNSRYLPQIQAMNATQAPFATAYPELALMTDQSAVRGKRNILDRNVQIDGSPILVSYFMPVLNALGAVAPENEGRVKSTNTYVNHTASFMDVNSLDLRLKSGSILANGGFQSVDTSQIGLQLDQFRTQAPKYVNSVQNINP